MYPYLKPVAHMTTTPVQTTQAFTGNVVSLDAYRFGKGMAVAPMSIETMPTQSIKNAQQSKSEVFPFKKSSDIKAMQTYFLTRYQEAKSTVKALQALRNWLWFTLGINIGFRGGDVCQLKWGQLLNEDYSFKKEYESYIKEQKTGKFRQIMLNENAKSAVKWYFSQLQAMGQELPAMNAYLFESGKGGKGFAEVNELDATEHNLANKSFCKILKAAAKDVGITYNVGTHSLRKTFGYRYYKAYCQRRAQGVAQDIDGLAVLQWIFNHSSSNITLRYIGMDSEVMQGAYESLVGDDELCMEELKQYDR